MSTNNRTAMTGRLPLRLIHGGGNSSRKATAPPSLRALDGQGMTADDAGWAMIADAAEVALALPGLSMDGRRLFTEAVDSCRFAAGLPALTAVSR